MSISSVTTHELRIVDGVNVVDLDPAGVRRVRDVLRAGGFDCACIASLWDPGNHAWLGTPPFPTGYEAVRGRIGHVHVKDVADGPTWVVAGEGVCDWPAQVKARRALL